jgi:hypothetical protein
MRCLRAAALAALAALVSLLPASAMAETTWQVLQRFGWTGSWAASCNDPPSGRNIWINLIAAADGSVRRKLDRGHDAPPLMSVVDSAQIAGGDTLDTRLRNDDPQWGPADGRYYDVVMQKAANGGIRTFQSKGSDGKEYVKDGMFTATGQPSPWTFKCRD